MATALATAHRASRRRSADLAAFTVDRGTHVADRRHHVRGGTGVAEALDEGELS
jgi:hypothetical protein